MVILPQRLTAGRAFPFSEERSFSALNFTVWVPERPFTTSSLAGAQSKVSSSSGFPMRHVANSPNLASTAQRQPTGQGHIHGRLSANDLRRQRRQLGHLSSTMQHLKPCLNIDSSGISMLFMAPDRSRHPLALSSHIQCVQVLDGQAILSVDFEVRHCLDARRKSE